MFSDNYDGTFIGTTDKCNARNFKPDAAGLFYYGAAKICCKKILGNAYHIRMGKIYNLSDLYNHCPDCTSDIPESDHQKNILICIAFGLLVMNIIVFCLINDILKREVQITENRLLLERVKNETGMYRTISENYDKQKKREHEYKNQLALIAALASENRVDEINHYLKQYNHEIMQHTDFIDTNNVIVNAILNSKYQETREKGIVFVVKVNDLSDLRIKDEDIVLILSNLLNNAIEACEQCEKPIIKMKFVKEEHQIVLSVANTFSVTPVIVGKRYITTKTKEADRHGIGLENIKETVGKYDGSCVIKHDDDNFKVAILIHNQEK